MNSAIRKTLSYFECESHLSQKTPSGNMGDTSLVLEVKCDPSYNHIDVKRLTFCASTIKKTDPTIG